MLEALWRAQEEAAKDEADAAALRLRSAIDAAKAADVTKYYIA